MSLLETKEGREALIRGCDIIDGRVASACLALTSGVGCVQCDALADLHDPAKLAEMIAEEGRRLAVHMWAVKHEYLPICWGVRGDEYGGFWRMPQARAILAALLQIHDGAREQAERILRGEM